MSNPAQSGSLPPDLAVKVEQVGHAFEAAWKAGGRPALEPYLADSPPAVRAALLRELLRLDLAYRVRHNEKPMPDEYRARFPTDNDLILAVFGDTPTAAATPQPSPMPTVDRATASADEPVGDFPAIPGYEIQGQLPPGGMGVVYRAWQVGLKRLVAIKMIRSGVHAGTQERARFRVEAEAIAALSHPHIIPIYDSGEWNGMPYLTMEFAEGGSLAQALRGGPLPPAQATELVQTLARAVHFVHEHGLIHRDLKPANILLTDQGCPKLADFGLAKWLRQDQGLTRSQAVLGTASYMAPEQAAGDRQALGPAADVYSLGAILYEVLTGRPPFLAETYELTIHQVLSEEPPPPTQLRPEVPGDLEAICLKCLEKEPGRRFATALALAEELRRYQEGEPLSIHSDSAFRWHTRLARRAGYEILDILGAGFLGVVYKARHLRLGRIVAFEVIATRGRFESARLERLRPVAEAVARLHHPNIVEVYDFGEHNGEVYVAREYVEGSSLADESTGPRKPAEQTAALVETLARAVEHAHQLGLIHGELGPSRVLLGGDGAAKITGFGVARILRDQSLAASPSGYLAPEQVGEQAEGLGPATDVYALGAILYQLLTGRPPVLADTVPETLEQIRTGKPLPPRHWRPEVPRGLEAICLKCLEDVPAQRYPGAASLAEDLRRFRSGEVLFIDDLDDWPQQERWAQRAGYEILEALGRGRDGFSYRARQVALDRIVVLYRLTAQDRFVPAAKTRFRREAHLLARINHPNLVQLYDQGEQNDLAYFVREFVDGPSLAELVAEAPMTIPRAVEVVETLARALQAAHEKGVVSAGLTPSRVRLTPAGLPKITRLQMARPLRLDGDEGRPESELCRRTSYLAPEQLAGRMRVLDPATDVYALGAILYTLLTGRPPFQGRTLTETLEAIRVQAPQPPRQANPTIPPELEALCLGCLDKLPRRRPASALTLADELQDYSR
jgi:serine/threonine protein kinase